MTTPFVGRAGELATLTADLDAAVGGRGGVVLVAGEPGIGKTRLAEELAVRATARGVVVLWGRCWEGAGAPSFWPWVQVVRGYAQVQSGDPASLRHDLGAGAADIAQLVPAVHDCIPDLPAPPPLEPEAARFRLFDSLAGFLRTAAARLPLLLVLDDLHWADVPSLALLRFMSRELEGAGPLVVGNYRQSEVGQGHPLLAAVADLTRGQHRWLLLGGLGQRDVASFVAMAAGAEASEELAAEVYRQTDGNPFFVTEVVRLLASQGRLDPAARGAAVLGGWPAGGGQVGGGRAARSPLRGLPAIPEVAAVVGRDFELRVLQPASGLDAERLLVVGRRPRPHGWPGRSRVGSAAGGSRTRGPGGAVRAPARRAARAPARLVARRLKLSTPPTRGASGRAGPPSGRGGTGGEETAAKAVQMATLAGRRALEVLAWEDAAELFERALAALELAERPGPQQRCELLLAVGEARMAASDVPAARTADPQAGELARRIGSPEACRPGRPGPGVGVHQRGRRPGSGRAAGGGADGPGEGRQPAAGAGAGRAGQGAGVHPAGRAAPDAQRGCGADGQAPGRPATLAAVLFGRHLAVWGSERAEVAGERLAIATEVVGLAEQIGDRAMALRGSRPAPHRPARAG